MEVEFTKNKFSLSILIISFDQEFMWIKLNKNKYTKSKLNKPKDPASNMILILASNRSQQWISPPTDKLIILIKE